MPDPSARPPDHVLDLFAADGVLERLEGGQGTSWRAGDLVLCSGRDESEAWLAPVQARLAVRLDEQRPRALRLALPVPARDGSLTVDGWAATRFEPGTTPVPRPARRCVPRRTSSTPTWPSTVPERPAGLDARTDQWAVAERQAYDGDAAVRAAAQRPEPGHLDLVAALVAGLDDTDLGREQLVHADLAGNVLLDADGVPFVIDFSPAWRSPLWAEAVCVLDAVLWFGAPAEALDDVARGRPAPGDAAGRALPRPRRPALRRGALRRARAGLIPPRAQKAQCTRSSVTTRTPPARSTWSTGSKRACSNGPANRRTPSPMTDGFTLSTRRSISGSSACASVPPPTSQMSCPSSALSSADPGERVVGDDLHRQVVAACERPGHDEVAQVRVGVVESRSQADLVRRPPLHDGVEVGARRGDPHCVASGPGQRLGPGRRPGAPRGRA